MAVYLLSTHDAQVLEARHGAILVVRPELTHALGASSLDTSSATVGNRCRVSHEFR